MNRPPLEVADIVRCAGPLFVERSRRWITWQHQKFAGPCSLPHRRARRASRSLLGLRIFRHLLQLVSQSALSQVSGQCTPALAPSAGTGVAARQLRARRLHAAAGTGSARAAEQTADLQPTLSRQCCNSAGDRPRPTPPGSRDRLLQRAPYLEPAVATSSSCPLRAGCRRSRSGPLPLDLLAPIFFFPSKCSAESSAASLSPGSRTPFSPAHSSSTDTSYRSRNREPSPPGCGHCFVTTGSSTPNGLSAGQNMCCAISAHTPIGSPSRTTGWWLSPRAT